MRFLLKVVTEVLSRKGHDGDAVLIWKVLREIVAAKFDDAGDAEVVGGDEQLAHVDRPDVEGAQVRVLQQQIHYFAAYIRQKEVSLLFRVQGRCE